MLNTITRQIFVFMATFSFIFAADVDLSLDADGNLTYNSTSDIYGFQFSHNDCASSAGGGDTAEYGFTVSASATTVLRMKVIIQNFHCNFFMKMI